MTPSNDYKMPSSTVRNGQETSGHTVFQRGHIKFFPSIEKIKL